jgi:hypothetical protein
MYRIYTRWKQDGVNLGQKEEREMPNKLRTDDYSRLGVKIEQIELRCVACGSSFMTPVPWETGNFPRNWYECPKGCNKGAAKKSAA